MDKFPCQTCRARHYKGDRVVPVCGRCRNSNRTCVPAFNIRFRRDKVVDAAGKGFHGKGTLMFSSDQKWVETPRTLTFVDCLAKLGEQRKLSPGNDVDFADCHTSSPCPASAAEANTRQSARSDQELEYSPSVSPGSIPLEGIISEHIDPVQMDSTEPVNDSMSDIDRASTNFSLTVYSLPEQGNIPRHDEARRITPEYSQLLYCFKAAIGWPWFDITDPNFTMEALRLAPTTPLLLYALLATACIHKSRRKSVQSVAYELEMQAEDLHEKCISILLPIIQQADLVTDSAFLACNTFLRLYEEIGVHSRDDARHLLGGSASVAEFQNQQLDFDSLSRAAFWVHLRQDAVVAIMNHRGPEAHKQ